MTLTETSNTQNYRKSKVVWVQHLCQSLVSKLDVFPYQQIQLLAFRVHDEGLKVWVELRHKSIHKVLDSGPSLQHPCHTKNRAAAFRVCVSCKRIKGVARQWDELDFYFPDRNLCETSTVELKKASVV